MQLLGSNPIQYPYQLQPQIITTAGTNIYVGQTFQQAAPVAQEEPTPLDWLRHQVDEVCELASAA